MTNPEQLKEEEIDVIIEALDAWEEQGSDSMGAQILTSVLREGAPEDMKAEIDKKLKDYMKEKEQRLKIRKERATLLKAKLIMIKQANAINQLERAS